MPLRRLLGLFFVPFFGTDILKNAIFCLILFYLKTETDEQMKMKKILTVGRALLLAVLLIGSMPTDSLAQNRSDLRASISEWGRCRTVAITRSKGDVAICENATYAFNGTMIGLFNRIKELYNQDTYISDVQAAEDGSWLLLYGDNEVQWKGIPASLEKTLNDFKAAGDVISLVTFNSKGEWIAVTNNQISASHNHLAELLTAGMDECGELLAACVSEECTVLRTIRYREKVGRKGC